MYLSIYLTIHISIRQVVLLV